MIASAPGRRAREWTPSSPGRRDVRRTLTVPQAVFVRQEQPMMCVWSHRPPFLHLGLFIAAYVLGCGFAETLAIVPGTGISIWPPSGLFIATLVLASRPSRRCAGHCNGRSKDCRKAQSRIRKSAPSHPQPGQTALQVGAHRAAITVGKPLLIGVGSRRR
jgi:hypothetical protein